MDEVKFELSQGRRCQIFAVFTVKHDVTQRLKALLAREVMPSRRRCIGSVSV